MKRVMMGVMIGIMFLVIGCGAHFGNEAQYDKGDWYLFAGSQEVAQIQRLKTRQQVNALAIKKLEAQPVITESINGVFQGYGGFVHNLSRMIVNIIITSRTGGLEIKSYFLSPGGQPKEKYQYLLPDDYHADFYIGGRKVGEWDFTVNSIAQYEYFGEKVHWYLAYNPLWGFGGFGF